MNDYLIILLGLQLLIIIAVSFFAYKSRSKNNYYELKYSKIIDADKEVEMANERKTEIDKSIEKLRLKTDEEIKLAKQNAEKKRDDIEQNIVELQLSYKEKKIIFAKLIKEAAIYDEIIELAELGFYKPHYDFDTSEKYKEQTTTIKNQQKKLISDKNAITCHTEWSLEGSKAKGRTMTNRSIRLTARAFNNECDAAIANTRWNNIERMEQRIEKAFTAINKLNESNAIIISRRYLILKIKELRLTYEYKNKKQQEKEEQTEIRQQMREEAKFEQEAEKSLKEEFRYNKLLEKAKSDAEKATGSQLEKLQEKIASLDKELIEAHSKSERAKSMAQQTKRGHVYVISNIGSFGKEVYKIGMTRRLEPYDRVKELGSASVPFIFDVHAMIYADDAPSLENKLHKSFAFKRMNLVNNRKEFFQVSLEDIAKEVKKIAPDAEFIETAEARQYKESQAIRTQRKEQNNKVDILNQLPENI